MAAARTCYQHVEGSVRARAGYTVQMGKPWARLAGSLAAQLVDSLADQSVDILAAQLVDSLAALARLVQERCMVPS